MSNDAESRIQRDIMVGVSELGTRIFRNNVGQATFFDPKTIARLELAGAIKQSDRRFVRYGLSPGSSDLIGWTPRTITQSDVGRLFAVFTALEVKAARGRTSPDQKKFIRWVLDGGGLAAVVRSREDAVQEIEGWRCR